MVLTDRSQLRLGRGLVRTVAECVDAGLTHVVVREHDLAPGTRAALVEALLGVPGLIVISSRIPDPAAHGLHQPAAADAPPSCNAVSASPVRRPEGAEVTWTPRCTRGSGGGAALVGRSCHDAADVRRAAGDGVDYVTLSPFAATRSKPGHGPALGPEEYAGHTVPVFALGGIGVENAPAARRAGAHGVAVMGEVMRSADPASTVARLLEAVR
ncbi:thiamine phosphate synthase [Nocardioides sp. JQ2195]|nr:thiamine phosphate synthase [Nocardioides sp. JQ2195]